MDKKCSLYCLYDKKDCKIRYIGVSIEPEQRFKNHQYESKNPNTKNLGKSKWLRTVNELCYKILFWGTEKECYKKENKIITKHKKKRNLVNSTIGGDRPPKLNELDEELYKQTVLKISEKCKDRKYSIETKQKMSDSQKKVSREYLKVYHKGKNNPRAFKVAQYDLEKNLIKVWDYAKQAINELNLDSTSISNCLSGRQKTAGGFIWKKYING
jgi:hypothetical protein